MTAEKFRADGAPLGSEQFYIARDLVECADVNKRIPLGVACTDARERAVVEEKLRSLYGGEQMARVFSGEGLIGEFPLSSLPEEWESLRIDGIPLTERKRFDFSDLREIMGRLRGEGGCEWDRAQDHGSIRINLIEEAYELVDAIDHADIPGMLEESGDVLMQAVFHTQIAKEGGEFGYEDMLTALCRKLLDRHTHIFGENHADNADQALLF